MERTYGFSTCVELPFNQELRYHIKIVTWARQCYQQQFTSARRFARLPGRFSRSPLSFTRTMREADRREVTSARTGLEISLGEVARPYTSETKCGAAFSSLRGAQWPGRGRDLGTCNDLMALELARFKVAAAVLRWTYCQVDQDLNCFDTSGVEPPPADLSSLQDLATWLDESAERFGSAEPSGVEEETQAENEPQADSLPEEDSSLLEASASQIVEASSETSELVAALRAERHGLVSRCRCIAAWTYARLETMHQQHEEVFARMDDWIKDRVKEENEAIKATDTLLRSGRWEDEEPVFMTTRSMRRSQTATMKPALTGAAGKRRRDVLKVIIAKTLDVDVYIPQKLEVSEAAVPVPTRPSTSNSQVAVGSRPSTTKPLRPVFPERWSQDMLWGLLTRLADLSGAVCSAEQLLQALLERRHCALGFNNEQVIPESWVMRPLVVYKLLCDSMVEPAWGATGVDVTEFLLEVSLEEDFQSATFELEAGLSDEDRLRLTRGMAEASQLMKDGLTFDEARLKIVTQRMAQMGVDSSGMPTDPKAFTFEKVSNVGGRSTDSGSSASWRSTGARRGFQSVMTPPAISASASRMFPVFERGDDTSGDRRPFLSGPLLVACRALKSLKPVVRSALLFRAVPLIVAAAVIILLRLLQIGWTRDPGLPALLVQEDVAEVGKAFETIVNCVADHGGDVEDRDFDQELESEFARNDPHFVLSHHENSVPWPTPEALEETRSFIQSEESPLGQDVLASYPDVPISEELFCQLPLWPETCPPELRRWIFQVLATFAEEQVRLPAKPSRRPEDPSEFTITARRIFGYFGLGHSPAESFSRLCRLLLPREALAAEEEPAQVLVKDLWMLLHSQRSRPSGLLAPVPDLATFCNNLLEEAKAETAAAAAPKGKAAPKPKGKAKQEVEEEVEPPPLPEEATVAFSEKVLLQRKTVLRSFCSHGGLLCRRRGLEVLFPTAGSGWSLATSSQAAALQELQSLVPEATPEEEEAPA
ncbi:hypothetical protein AK812_SmicGene25849 [Symbiodinium microadriaticum]|uniref:Uncharacterized protein n=1 Tax=Symbiodinium microadriaticum TaxID=2951 RepID=A0A1Q9DB35_SYMMI|nr:hypothetical protein AK812_SmicGene25849 [Symbiodinium microadriaticum]